MPNVTAVCYLFSLLFYGMGYFKTLVIKNAVSEPITTYDYTIYISLATGYFVLAIFFAIIGSVYFYLKKGEDHKVTIIKDIKIRDKAGRVSNDRRSASIPRQLTQIEYSPDLYRRMPS